MVFDVRHEERNIYHDAEVARAGCGVMQSGMVNVIYGMVHKTPIRGREIVAA